MSEKKQQTAYPLRMPKELREKLESSAAQGKRSLNAEIIARLEASYDYIPESRGITAEEGFAELNELSNQRTVVTELKIAKIHALVALQEELEQAETPESKAALQAAITVADAEKKRLYQQDSDLSQRYYTLMAQIKLNAKVPQES